MIEVTLNVSQAEKTRPIIGQSPVPVLTCSDRRPDESTRDAAQRGNMQVSGHRCNLGDHCSLAAAPEALI